MKITIPSFNRSNNLKVLENFKNTDDIFVFVCESELLEYKNNYNNINFIEVPKFINNISLKRAFIYNYFKNLGEDKIIMLDDLLTFKNFDENYFRNKVNELLDTYDLLGFNGGFLSEKAFNMLSKQRNIDYNNLIVNNGRIYSACGIKIDKNIEFNYDSFYKKFGIFFNEDFAFSLFNHLLGKKVAITGLFNFRYKHNAKGGINSNKRSNEDELKFFIIFQLFLKYLGMNKIISIKINKLKNTKKFNNTDLYSYGSTIQWNKIIKIDNLLEKFNNFKYTLEEYNNLLSKIKNNNVEGLEKEKIIETKEEIKKHNINDFYNIVFDIDGVLSKNKTFEENYIDCRKNYFLEQYLKGKNILLNTARFFLTYKGNELLIDEELKKSIKNKFNFNNKIYKKPFGEMYVDDNAFTYTSFNNFKFEIEKKPVVILCLAGKSSRLPNKFNINIGDGTLLENIVKKYKEKYEVYGIINKEQEKKDFLFLDKIITIDNTNSQVETLYKGLFKLLYNKEIGLYTKIIIGNGDTLCDEIINIDNISHKYDFGVQTFKDYKEHFSYSIINKNDIVQIAEKKVISDNANSGFYYFKKVKDVIDFYEFNFLSITDIIQLMINNIKSGINIPLKNKPLIIGTLDEYNNFLNNKNEN